MMSRVVKATGDENAAREKMKQMRALGHIAPRSVLAKMVGEKDPEKISKALFGLKEKEYYFRYKRSRARRRTRSRPRSAGLQSDRGCGGTASKRPPKDGRSRRCACS